MSSGNPDKAINTTVLFLEDYPLKVMLKWQGRKEGIRKGTKEGKRKEGREGEKEKGRETRLRCINFEGREAWHIKVPLRRYFTKLPLFG